MDGLIVSGRSSFSVKSRSSNNTPTKQRSPSKFRLSKDSRASTTDLNVPSESDKTGNPMLSTEDILKKISTSVPPPGTETQIPTKDSDVTMEPRLSSPFLRQLDTAATTIQRQWRAHQIKKQTCSKSEYLDGVQISMEVKEMLKKEREKLRQEKEEENRQAEKRKSLIDEKKHKARLSAIEDLNRKREEKRRAQQREVEAKLEKTAEEKRQLQEKLLEEEVKLASSKVVKKKKNVREIKRPPSAKARTPKQSTPKKPPLTPHTPQSKPENVIDEIFFSPSKAFPSHDDEDSDILSPRVAWQPSPDHRESSDRREGQTRKSQQTALNTTRTGDESMVEKKKAYSSLLETLKLLEDETDQVLNETKSSGIVIPPTPRLTEGEIYKLSSLGKTDLADNRMEDGRIKGLLSFLDQINSTPPSEADTVGASAVSYKQDSARIRAANEAAEEITESVKYTQEQLNQKAQQLEILKSELTSTATATSQLQAEVFASRLECEEKGKAVTMLQRALDEQRDLTLRLTNEQEKDAQQRLSNQKQEYEATIQRHLGFIDQLIADKKQLSEKVETLVSQLRSTEKKLGDRVRYLEDNLKVELKKQKELIEAAEKNKREKWINEKSNQIKEMTVKGLEPEIQKLIAKNKNEIKRLKALHEAELLEADERASKRFVEQVEEMREQFAKEKESACVREREYGQKRYEKQIEQEEQAYQQQRRRLYAEVEEEKQRMNELLNKQRKDLDDEKTKAINENKRILANNNAQNKIELEKIRNDHENVLRDLKLRLEVEKEQWLENQKQKQEAIILNKEREIRANLKTERDKEIELVINKLEEDHAILQEESAANLDCRMRRLKDKYDSQIEDLEHVNNTTQTKLNAIKERATELEADNIRLRANIKSVEKDKDEVERVSNRLKSERERVESVVREEFSERLVRLEEEAKTAKAELVEVRTRNKLELERVNASHETEMQEVQSRIKSAFNKRDEVIRELRDKASSASSRADHLESLLIKQREELLRPPTKAKS